jgi:methylenetetrahydrofolate reductase (NADPH)
VVLRRILRDLAAARLSRAVPGAKPADAPAAAVERIVALMAGFSIEATRPSAADIAALDKLARGTRIFLSAVPGRPDDEVVSAAVRVRDAGFEPVPHVAVRNFATAAVLDDFLARLNSEAAVTRVLVIAGDRAEFGPFRRARDVIDSGLLQRRGIRSIGITGYPDGHPRIGADELDRALTEKIAAAAAAGLAVEIVTQFCFEARAVLDYIARLRGFGVTQPVRIGLAGPTGLASLLRYAGRCGVRASAQALNQRAGLVLQMFGMQMFSMIVPDGLVRSLAAAAPPNVSVHFFSFGGLPASARWASAVAAGLITIEGDNGFRVAPELRKS